MTGRVFDTSTGEPLTGAHVVHLGADGSIIGGAATDGNGVYVYEWNDPAPILVRVSFIGYEPLRAVVNPSGAVDFELVPVVYDLGEGAEVFGDAPGGSSGWALAGLGLLLLLALTSED